MKVVIFDKRVHKNLALFRHLIHRQAEKPNRFYQVAKKTYKAFVNCNTGEMRFEDLDKKRSYPKGEWKPILIQLRPSEEGAFEIISPENAEAFGCEDLKEEAYVLLTKTIHILNQLAYDPKQGKNPFWVLRHIAHVDFVLSEEEEGQRNLVHDAWHNIDREYAEYLLKWTEPGTYLLRKDEFAQILEDCLNETLPDPVTCITLTYRDWKEKISEKTLIFKDQKWLFYNNDPDLTGPNFDTVKELLATMEKELKRPLLAD